MATVKISDVGGANPVSLVTENEPYPIPHPQRDTGASIYRTRRSASSAGRRVAQFLGSGVGFSTLSLNVPYMTAAQLATLEGRVDGGALIEVTLDNGSTRWAAACTSCKPTPWGVDATRFEVALEFEILGVIT